jgi:3-methyladenine DNA glycosylase/8-oxoguanine DNA glycosylase
MITFATATLPQPYTWSLWRELANRVPVATTDLFIGDAWRRVLRVGDVLALVEVTPNDTDHLALHLITATGEVDLEALQTQMMHILNTHATAAFYRAIPPEHRDLFMPVWGLPLVRTPDVYEALISVMIAQQILWSTALKGIRWLLEWGGHKITYEGQHYYGFPTPAQLASATVDDLRPLKITGQRMERMILLSQRIVSGDLDLNSLETMSDYDRYLYLMAINGVGHWTAAMTLDTAFGQTVHVPDQDVGVQAAINRYIHGQAGRASAAQVKTFFASWGEQASAAAHAVLSRWVIENYPVRETPALL